jgi:hypothetical protein
MEEKKTTAARGKEERVALDLVVCNHCRSIAGSCKTEKGIHRCRS